MLKHVLRIAIDMKESIDSLYWAMIVVICSLVTVSLGITIQASLVDFPTGVAYYLSQWIHPDLYTAVSLLAIPAMILTLAKDRMYRLGFLHFMPTLAYALTGVGMWFTGAFPVGLGIMYGGFSAAILAGFIRTLSYTGR